MPNWVLAVVAFVVTVLETFIASKQTQAVSQRRIIHACNWALLFELVLLIDILTLITNWRVVVVPILVGAWLGMYWSFRARH